MKCPACEANTTSKSKSRTDYLVRDRTSKLFGFNLLCFRCVGSLKSYATAAGKEPSEAVGLLWLAARVKTLVRIKNDPDLRRREREKKRALVKAARSRLDELEWELVSYTFSISEARDEGMSEDEIWGRVADLEHDTSWYKAHNELIALCHRFKLSSEEFNDHMWDPIYN